MGDFNQRGVSDRTAAALRLAELGIAVVPGTRATEDGRCSCGDLACRAPGRHPIDSGWLLHASTDSTAIARWWEYRPDANIVAPLLGPVHVVDAPARIGAMVLDRLGGHRRFTGPVAVTPTGRYQFWSAPGVAVELGVMLDRRGCSQAGADVRILREGSYVLAPPSTLGPFADYRWKMPPRTHVRYLPGSTMLARLLVEAYQQLVPG